MDEEDKKEKVQNISVRTFTIASCPEKVYQRFLKFCKENAKNVRYFQDDDNKLHKKEEVIYHIGLRMLIDSFEADAKNMMLYEKIKSVESRINLLEDSLKTKQPSKKKTFG